MLSLIYVNKKKFLSFIYICLGVLTGTTMYSIYIYISIYVFYIYVYMYSIYIFKNLLKLDDI